MKNTDIALVLFLEELSLSRVCNRQLSRASRGGCADILGAVQWSREFGAILFVGLVIFCLSPMNVRAQDAAGATAGPIASLQLNKLEEVKDGCRVYFVVSNKTSKAIKTLKIDLILFRSDGVIGKRVFADFAPVRAGSKQQVKLFNFDGTKCSELGSLLINDAVECRDEDGVVNQCYSRLEVSHLGDVAMSK